MKKLFLLSNRQLVESGVRSAILLGLLGMAPAAIAQVSFGTATTYPTGSAPLGIAEGDLNGDGRMDIVTANQTSNDVSVLMGQAGAPAYALPISYTTGGTRPTGVAIGDVNNDGRLDIVVGNQSSNSVGILLGQAGAMAFAPAVAFATGGATSNLPTLGDVNGDGRLDIVIGNTGSGNLSVLLGQTGPTLFGPATLFATGDSTPIGTALADVNLDGRLDIVVANSGTGTAGVLLGQGSPGSFGPAVQYAAGGGGTTDVSVADLNGDGRLDIVAVNTGANTVGVLLGQTGALAFAAAVTYPSGGTAPNLLSLADINGDGRLDIIAGNTNANTVGILPAQGAAGSFGAATTFSTGGTTPYDIGVNDLNGDGRPDIAVTNLGTNTVGVLLNTGTFVVASDLVVSTGSAASPTAIPAGTYNSITVTGTGYGVLAGNVTVITSVTVQNGGVLGDGCRVIGGAGSFTLAAGSTLGICNAAGITGSGATGSIQVTGTRVFSTDASYGYNGITAQVTGSGLPATVRALATNNSNPVTLSAPVQVTQAVGVGGTGNLVLGGQALTLRSSATGTALAVNTSTGIVSGTATVQRYLDPSLNAGLGYRHLSAPVNNTTVADLATASFTPEVSQASVYNASATPGTTSPFPTVFGYDQARVTLANAYSPFDRGFFVPANTAAPLVVGRGYAVNLAANQVVDFVGQMTSGDQTVALTRNAASSTNAADAGWQLVGNPYPSPIDASLIAAVDRSNLDAAMYVFESTSQYAGAYRSFVNGVGGDPLVGLGQGMFMRVSTGQISGGLTFRNSQRVTSFATQVPVRRGTADARPLVQLTLRGATGMADVYYAYAQAGATPAQDVSYDAVKLPNTTGLNLTSEASTGESLAIDARPVFAAGTVLPLTVGVPAAGTYSLNAATIANLPAGLDAVLTDAFTGQTVTLRPQASYSFVLTAAQAAAPLTGRFTLRFASRSALASAPGLTAAEVTLYPNPAHDSFVVLVPAVGQAASVQVELLTVLGQTVRHQLTALPAAGARLTIDTSGLVAGVYTLRLRAGANTVTKRIILN